MRKLILALVVMIVSLGITGCSQKKPLTPQEIAAERERQIQMTTRIYEGKTPEEVLLAADRVFRLADDDYVISHQGNMIQAKRNWFIYAVLAIATGTDTWIVQTSPVEKGTQVIAIHSGQSQSMTPSPTVNFNGSMGMGMTSMPTLTNMTTSPAIYQLFFSRLDYLLNKNINWLTCKEANKLFQDGTLDPFCTVANDRTPDGKTAIQRKKEQEQNNIN
ncbi:lipoprotein [uncultured Bilophila sp.]|uniref:LptM family lipoprotein n=1 Tax=uncultured Bilophila sp. TaxID=529385 RepID=UPI00266F2C6E|nr:hypothetical protein [uncultured Bilophila sp.]